MRLEQLQDLIALYPKLHVYPLIFLYLRLNKKLKTTKKIRLFFLLWIQMYEKVSIIKVYNNNNCFFLIFHCMNKIGFHYIYNHILMKSVSHLLNSADAKFDSVF